MNIFNIKNEDGFQQGKPNYIPQNQENYWTEHSLHYEKKINTLQYFFHNESQAKFNKKLDDLLKQMWKQEIESGEIVVNNEVGYQTSYHFVNYDNKENVWDEIELKYNICNILSLILNE